jgi:YD repeat-containing protein
MPVPWEPTPSCPQTSCAKEGTYKLELSKLDTAGRHRLEVRVTDFAGNQKVRDIEFEYFPATGMKDEYVMHYFPLPDGEGDEDEEEHPKRPELAVNVMNGNLVYRQVDVDLASTAQVDLELERYYNSQLPESESSEWGEGWTLAETPELEPDGAGSALAAVATMTQDPSLAQRYFSLWLDMPSPEGAKAGYELRFKLLATDSYDVTLSKWQGASETVLASKSAVGFADGDSLAIVDEGSTVSAWTDTGTGFAPLLSVGDATFEQGRAGLHGAGNIVRLADFKAGELGVEPSNVPTELAALPVTEPFDGSEASGERFQSEWSALSWAGGGANAKGGDTTSGWRPLSAFSTVNGAFHHQHLDGSGEIPEEAELRDSSGAVESDVALPTEEGQEEFDPELQATVKKKAGGGYLLTDETGESATAVAFGETGQPEALVSEGDAKVDYTYEGGELAEIAVEDPGTLVTDEPSEVESPEPEATEGTPLFHSAFGSVGSAEGELKKPADVALGADGDIWVADTENDRIQHLNPAGEYIDQFGGSGSGDGQLNRPTAITIDAEGDLWVADKSNSRIQKLSPSGEYLEQFGSIGSEPGQFDRPEGIAIDAAGDIWVADTYNNRIQKFTPQGELIEVVAPEGLGSIKPVAIDAGPEGTIWVTDWTNNRVAALSEAGELVRSFGASGTEAGQLRRPAGVEADSHGNVWVSESWNSRIQRFDEEGNYIDQIGESGSGDGQFSVFALTSSRFGFAVGEDRRLWIADRNNNRVQRWDPPYEISEEPLPEDDDPSVELEHDGGLVEAVSGEETGVIDYEHEGELLTAVDGPKGETAYEYDGADRLTKVTLPNGTYGEIAYFSDGRVEAVTVAPEGTNAKTTRFTYTDAPDRRTEVEVPGAPNLTYEIGEDGSVLRWWNTAKPPELTLLGTLYDNREEDGALWAGDHELQAWAEDEEGVASLEIIVGGDTLVEELTCEQVGGPPPECTKTEPLPWVMETEANPPGHMQIEVIATDSDGESAAERFWVDIPEPPPPLAPGTPVPPRFGEIKQFREQFGLEVVFPVATKIERNERIFNLIKAWHEPNTPAGQVARATREGWGVPLRAVDSAELEFREAYVDQAATTIPQWVSGAGLVNDYAGYYVDHSKGGAILVGFTQAQSARVDALKASGQFSAAADRILPYANEPQQSIAHLETLGAQIVDATASMAPGLVNGVGIDMAANKVKVGASNVGQAEALLQAQFGSQAPFYVYPMPVGKQFSANWARPDGAVRGGEYIEMREPETAPCSAGFGAWDKAGQKPDGSSKYRHFIVTAGHCAVAGAEIVQWDGASWENADWKRVLGTVRRYAFTKHPNGYGTDAAAIRLNSPGLVPRLIQTEALPVRIKGSTSAHRGMIVCKSGSTSQGKECGDIQWSVEAWAWGEQYGNGNPKLWTIEMQLRAPGGDSGGPIWQRGSRKIVGTLTGGLPGFPSANFTPAEPVTGYPFPGSLAALGASEPLHVLRYSP